MNAKDDAYNQTPASANLSKAAGEEISFQVDMAMTSSNGSHEQNAGIVCVRLDPHSKLERET